MGGVPPIPPLESLAASMDNSLELDIDNIYGTYYEQEISQFNQPAVDMEMFTERAFASYITDAFSTSNFLSVLPADTSDFHGGVPQMEDIENYHEGEDEGEIEEGDTNNTRKKGRGKSSEKYEFGKLLESNWYIKFLAPDKDGLEGSRTKTLRLSSRDRDGAFRSLVHMPLTKIEGIAQLFLDNGIICPTGRMRNLELVRIKAELHVMAAICHHTHGHPFRILSINTNISKEEHRKFFHEFIHYFFENHKRYVYLPKQGADIETVMERYREVGLPGAIGSKDVVHIRWCRCPAGDYNRAKGRYSYPSVAFQCITDFDRRIMVISRAQFGTRNDISITRRDHNVHSIVNDWYKDMEWEYFNEEGEVKRDKGVYLICDGGYVKQQTSICPFESARLDTLEGYFSTNLESVRKDVECVFGILKKRWKILDHGFQYRSISTCEKIFFTCCCLHNMMLDQMSSRKNDVRVLRGNRGISDGLWLAADDEGLQIDEPMIGTRETARKHRALFGLRRKRLAVHLQYARQT